MKIFLIVIGCILLYIFGAFVTLTIKDIDEESILIVAFWPVTILFFAICLLYMKLKKFSIAIVETIYQVCHDKKEDKDE